jgi:transcriptional regulator with GAF, ATPase, and Fis domain
MHGEGHPVPRVYRGGEVVGALPRDWAGDRRRFCTTFRDVIRLEVEQGEARGQFLERETSELTLGRAPSSDLLLPDWHISGSHGVLQILPQTEGGGVRYRDLRSTNGSRIVRGRDLVPVDSSCQFERDLQPGDKLMLGDPEHPVVVRVVFPPTYRPPGSDPFAVPPTAPVATAAPANAEARVVAMRHVSAIAEARQIVEADPISLKAVYEATRKIGAALEMDEVLDAVTEAVFALLGRATHLTIVLRDETREVEQAVAVAAGGANATAAAATAAAARKESSAVSLESYVPVTTRVRDSKGPSTEAIPVSKSVFRRVVEQRAAVLAADALRDVGETASIMGARILSTMAVPLWKGEDILGVLQVDNRASPGIFRERDLDLLTVVAQQASLAIANARLYRRVLTAERHATAEAGYLKQRAQKKFEGIIGESSAMRAVFTALRKVVDTPVTVLIEGETGTGKERVASAIHYQSRRRDKLFVAQNCAALPETLLESELFGHKKGAFTGADQDKKGLFELADGGTMFLDEVGEMPLSLQSKLLRVLQEGEIRPLGSGQTKSVEVRIVAATNRKLEEEVKAGRFRQDLYFRLQVFPIRLPTLRERRDDIALLAQHFLKRYSGELGKPVAGLSQQALELLMSYQWPGNVRELENEVQRIVIQSDPGSWVMPTDLSPRIRNVEGILDKIQPPRGTLKDMIEHIEKWLLIEALREHGNNKSATAKTLGITREGLHKKLKGYGIG